MCVKLHTFPYTWHCAHRTTRCTLRHIVHTAKCTPRLHGCTQGSHLVMRHTPLFGAAILSYPGLDISAHKTYINLYNSSKIWKTETKYGGASKVGWSKINEASFFKLGGWLTQLKCWIHGRGRWSTSSINQMIYKTGLFQQGGKIVTLFKVEIGFPYFLVFILNSICPEGGKF